MEKNKLILILPYFGKFSNLFDIFYKTVKCNKKVDFLIFTDNVWCYEEIANVRVIKETFADFRGRFKNKLGNQIILNEPYKLCDYKPTYGYVLQDFICGYRYWGYCDCDLIFGDLDGLLSPLMLENYDKIFAAGHLTLYKNTEENNSLFCSDNISKELFLKVSSNKKIFGYDEDFFGKDNIHDVFLNHGKKVFCGDYSANPSVFSGRFKLVKYDANKRCFIESEYKSEQFYWYKGHLYKITKVDRKIERNELAYMHFQMRKMYYKQDVLNSDGFRIIPNRFISNSMPESIQQWEKADKKIYFNHHRLDLLWRKVKNRIKR